MPECIAGELQEPGLEMPGALAAFDEAPNVIATGLHPIDDLVQRVEGPEDTVVGEKDPVGAVGAPFADQMLPGAEIEPGVLAMEHGGARRLERETIRLGRWRVAGASDECLVTARLKGGDVL